MVIFASKLSHGCRTNSTPGILSALPVGGEAAFTRTTNGLVQSVFVTCPETRGSHREMEDSVQGVSGEPLVARWFSMPALPRSGSGDGSCHLVPVLKLSAEASAKTGTIF